MGFDAGLPYELDPQVSIRPEPFGALAYNYGNRRLTLITAQPLVDVVNDLGEHPSARAAVAAWVPPEACSRYEGALERLHVSGVIRAR